MAVVLALVAAASWGASDFLAGLASRKASALNVVVGAHLVGFLAMVALAPAFGGHASAKDLLWGAAAGVSGGIGAALLYRGLAVGRMAVVAPITATGAAAIPAVVGIGTGDALAAGGFVGIVLALVAVVLIALTPVDVDDAALAPEAVVAAPGLVGALRRRSLNPAAHDAERETPAGLLGALRRRPIGAPMDAGHGRTQSTSRRSVTVVAGGAGPMAGIKRWLHQPGIIYGVTAGVGFSGFSIGLDGASADSGWWPLLAARAGSVFVLGSAAFVVERRLVPPRGARRETFFVGALDVLAAVLFLVAVREGMLSVVAVLVSLYPGVTVLLALFFVGERCTRVQVAGLALGAGAIALIAAA